MSWPRWSGKIFAGAWRRARVRKRPDCRLDGRELINFGSNDYLGLAADPRLAAGRGRSSRAEGWGSGASPLGHRTRPVAPAIGDPAGRVRGDRGGAGCSPRALPPTLGAVAALVGPGDVVYCDRKNHASLWDGCRLSRADVRVYPHGDCQRLASLLAQSHKYRRRLIVTDGLFSMDGDLAPLADLVELAERHDAMLLVDEAHATGVFGDRGRGRANIWAWKIASRSAWARSARPWAAPAGSWPAADR